MSLILCLGPFLGAQTPVGGIINNYTPVEAVDSCAATLRVTNPDGFTAGLAVLLIQMKGAQILTDESARFGEVVDIGAAGKYERNRIVSVTGNEIVLENNLANAYRLEGKVQLVSLPEYDDAVVTDVLRARPWDGASGGVIALAARGVLTLQADIDAGGAGFRGGLSVVIEETRCDNIFQRNPSDYGVEHTSWKGAPKGEGIAEAYNGAGVDRFNGRGPQANGGGGGNDHNAGGGGGGNGGAGGNGGENFATGLGCDGRYPGLGGRLLPNLPDRIFLGGGGGAGHENNMVGTNGGNGGGIVVILADVVAGNGFAVRSNGQTPPVTSGDGGGGGGAGGTILLLSSRVEGALALQANGGGGGGINNGPDPSRCMGPGGGGGGGRILLSPGLPTPSDVGGGASGRGIKSNTCSDGTNGATDGNAGRAGRLDTLPQGLLRRAPAITAQPTEWQVCTGGAGALTLDVEGSALSYQWQVDRGNGFEDIAGDNIFLGAQSRELTLAGADPAFGGYRFRLRIRSDCFAEVLSDPIPLFVTPLPRAGFAYSTQPGGSVQFSNESRNAQTYLWDFGDGATDTGFAPLHQYAVGGAFHVTLVARNGCGADTLDVEVTAAIAPSAVFTSSPASGCQPLDVRFQDQSTGNPDSLAWFFPGGNPETANGPDVRVRYERPGAYDVVLVAYNPWGSDTLRRPGAVVVREGPRAAFSATVADFDVQFDNLSERATTYRWAYGDGAESSDRAPAHTYAESGHYTVVLIAENECGRDTAVQVLFVGQPLQANFSVDRASGCAPHFAGFTNTSSGQVTSIEWQFPGGVPATSSDPNPRVTYEQPGDYRVVLTVRNANEQSVVEKDSLIIVRDYPEVDFDIERRSEQELAFLNKSRGAERYVWDFGDGATSTVFSPVHVYERSGVFDVTLNALNGSCGSAAGRTVVVMLTSAEAVALPAALRLFPNPTQDLLQVRAEDLTVWPLHIDLFNSQGQRLSRWLLTGDGTLDLGGQAPGVYLLLLGNDEGQWATRVVVE